MRNSRSFLSLASLVVLLPQILASLEGDALNAFKLAVTDRTGVLESWDPTLVNACTWLYITCDEENSVTRVDLANASLSGILVPELANLKNLKYLELFNNNLSGPIPKEFGNMNQLISLDLQHNALSGTVPSTIAQMSSLVFLRLNHNKLHGLIPSQMASMPSLQILDLSYNNLYGPVPRGGPFRKFTGTSFEGNPGLCGDALKKHCY